MSDERSYGTDMVPEPIPEWARVEDAPKVPVTEAEKHEHINADILRRTCHLSMQELIRKIRSLPPEGTVHVGNIVRLTAQELEAAIMRYRAVERAFHNSR